MSPAKRATRREAEASAFVLMKPEVLKALPQNPKGDPLEVARIAGIMAAKRTSESNPHVPRLCLSRYVDVEMSAVREWRRDQPPKSSPPPKPEWRWKPWSPPAFQH